jgi:phenylalanyl-tRNA synthetase alpha chain
LDSVAAVDWTAYETEALAAYGAAASAEELADVNVRYLGRKAPLPQALRGVRDRETGLTLNTLRAALEKAHDDAAARIARAALPDTSGVDVTIPGVRIDRGRLHLLTQIRREIEDIFLGMGYEVWDGNEVATVWENFDALTSDPGHPSRSQFDTFYIDEQTVLRTHTSPDQIRAMQQRKPPIYMVSPGRCYRRDTPDATHSPIFLQVECLAVDRGITLADLQGTVLRFFRALFGEEREVRMRTSFFPFTEPSVEFDVQCRRDKGEVRFGEGDDWLEILGCGMVHPNVLRSCGIDPDEYQGFAFGFGIERIAMLRHGLPDLRAFWENDRRVLGQF